VAALAATLSTPFDREFLEETAIPPCQSGELETTVDAGGHGMTVRLPWRLLGRPGLPVLLVLGGINSGRKLESWWSRQVGIGRSLDPTRFRLLSVDWADSEQQRQSPLLTQDQAQAIEALADHLGIQRLHGVIGASFGAMVGLALAERDRLFIDRLLLISGAHYSHPAATAARHLQREIVRLAEVAGLPRTGLALARGLAMSTYRTPELFAERFNETDAVDRLQSLESYLGHVGHQFARRYEADQFLGLSEALDLHQVDPSRIRVPATVVGVDSDQLVPLTQIRALAEGLAGPVALDVIQSRYGHDAFLTEHLRISKILNACFKEKTHATA